MDSWFLLAFALAAGALLWTAGAALARRRAGRQASAPAQPYHAVSIRPGLNACRAVWLQVGDRYLLTEAPDLPVKGCDNPHCECSFNQHDDRREPGERRDGDDPPADLSAAELAPRSSGGRRQDDQA